MCAKIEKPYMVSSLFRLLRREF